MVIDITQCRILSIINRYILFIRKIMWIILQSITILELEVEVRLFIIYSKK